MAAAGPPYAYSELRSPLLAKGGSGYQPQRAASYVARCSLVLVNLPALASNGYGRYHLGLKREETQETEPKFQEVVAAISTAR